MTTPYAAMMIQHRQVQIFAGTYKDSLKRKTKLQVLSISWMWSISILPDA